MTSSTHLTRLTRMLILGGIVAVTATSSALASVSRPPDVRDAASSITTTYLGTPPDISDAAAKAKLAVPDVLERYAAAHPYGIERSTATESTLVSRPPDVQDAALARKQASFGKSGSFDWGDYAIGIGSGQGLALLLAGGLVVGHRRHRLQAP
jgi:hypothetical protein